MNFELLYPDRAYHEELPPDPSFSALLAETGLADYLPRDAAGLFTSEPEVIRYRSWLICELSENEKLLTAVDTLAKLSAEFSETASHLRLSSRENPVHLLVESASAYVRFVEEASEAFQNVGDIGNTALSAIASGLAEDRRSREFQELRKNLTRARVDLLHARSMTIGVNLGGDLKPVEAGVVSINSEPFLSDNVIDRLMRLDFDKGGFHCIAPLSAAEKTLDYEERLRLDGAVTAAVEKLCSESLKRAVRRFSAHTAKRLSVYLRLGREAEFLSGACGLIMRLRKIGMNCTRAEVTDGEYSLKGLYDPALALVLGERAKERIVTNDITFDDGGRIYILTGPNSGGKTVFLRALEASQVMFRLGLPVPAVSAKMPVVGNVLTLFPRGETSGNMSGRLEEECRSAADMLDRCHSDSLVLCDEMFSSTGAADGAEIAVDVLSKLGNIGCRCVFSTHLSGLGERLADTDGVDTLSAELDNGQRTYRILRGETETKSDALTIAQKYGLGK